MLNKSVKVLCIYICVYIYIYIYICNHESNMPSRLSLQWLCHALGHMMYSIAQMHELPQSHCVDNQENTLFSWLHINYTHLASARFEHCVLDHLSPLYIYIYIYIYNTYYMLALGASWTHGLIAPSVRASERNSVVVGSNSTQANFL